MKKPTTKPFYTSKTLILNAVGAGVMILESNFALLQPLMSVNVYAVMNLALLVGNGALRAVTTTGLQFKR